MRTIMGIVLLVCALPLGCASGYSRAGPATGEKAQDYWETGAWRQNPESGEEQQRRIWWESQH